MKDIILSLVFYFLMAAVFVICAIIYLPLLFLFGPDKINNCRLLYAQAMILAGGQRLQILSPPPQSGYPYLFLFNHQSIFDGFMIGASLPNHFSGLGKREAFDIPVFGLVIKKFGIISIDRSNHQNSMLGVSQAVEKIKDGVSVVVFPEGTRTKDGQVGAFKKGAFKLAHEAKAKIVPVGISGSYHAQPYGTWLLRPRLLRINFGWPLAYASYKNLSINQLADLTREQIIKLSSNL